MVANAATWSTTSLLRLTYRSRAFRYRNGAVATQARIEQVEHLDERVLADQLGVVVVHTKVDPQPPDVEGRGGAAVGTHCERRLQLLAVSHSVVLERRKQLPKRMLGSTHAHPVGNGERAGDPQPELVRQRRQLRLRFARAHFQWQVADDPLQQRRVRAIGWTRLVAGQLTVAWQWNLRERHDGFAVRKAAIVACGSLPRR
jgi:hypothetical protein